MKKSFVALVVGMMFVGSAAADCDALLAAEKNMGMTAVEFKTQWYAGHGMSIPADELAKATAETKSAAECREKETAAQPVEEPTVSESEPSCK